ncbi:cupin domain-containing protein [Microbacterium sp. F51-2R]|uniref:cupin domain-containing protein n=1 Tax=Microbacterium sp. F51-2R TaxID=3445777 RepID=UPI003FA040C6
MITGVDGNGRSVIEVDSNTPHRLVTPGNTKNDIWRVTQLPVAFSDGDGCEEILAKPPKTGLLVRSVTFPPDAEWDRSLGYFDQSGPLSQGDDEGIPGLHATESVDIITVISGELWCVMQEGEVVLHPGDTLVQRGTKHSWSNRRPEPATIISVMLGAD